MIVNPAASFESIAHFATGLVGTIGVRIRDNQGGDTLARTTAGIVEDIAGSGIYRINLTSPSTAGQYTIVWDDADDHYATEELVVAYSVAATATPSDRDLCSFSDILLAVPGYDETLPSNEKTNTKLQDLITSESQLIHRESGREIVGLDVGPRFLPIDVTAWRASRVSIGDLATIDGATVELLSSSLAVLQTIDAAALNLVYGAKRHPLHEWEPITALELLTVRGAPALTPNQWLRITGTFGFPEIPAFIRTAAVNRTILRYISDVASAGTQFAASVDNLNLAAMFASARDAVDAIGAVLVA